MVKNHLKNKRKSNQRLQTLTRTSFERCIFFYSFSGKSNMAAKPCDLWHHMCDFCSSWKGGHMCKVSPRSFQPFQRRRFLKVKKKKNQYGCQITWLMTSKIFVEHFIPRWPSKMCILIRCSVLHMHLWRHNEGKDLWCHKNTTLIPQEECLLCATGTPIAWGTLVWSFPSICPAILEKIFKK